MRGYIVCLGTIRSLDEVPIEPSTDILSYLLFLFGVNLTSDFVCA